MQYWLGKNMTDEKAAQLVSTFVKPAQIDIILEHDADVYDESGNILLLFRKGILPLTNVTAFYDNTIQFASSHVNSNRGIASGKKYKGKDRITALSKTPRVYTNIIGYFDVMPVYYNYMLRQRGVKTALRVRETGFNMTYPDKFKKCIPLIRDIDTLYKKYAPDKYAKQATKARQIPPELKIDNTVFTTVTINVNYRTGIHTDKGDDINGFGNLVVIERGKYTGGETCFPQYGIGANVRTGDILFMDVHKLHGNLPVKYLTADAKRMSIVSYLREGMVRATQGITRKKVRQHLTLLQKTLKGKKGKRR